MKLSTDGLVTIATFTCVSGYNLNSTAVTSCQSNGKWNLPDPACGMYMNVCLNHFIIIILYMCNDLEFTRNLLEHTCSTFQFVNRRML